MCYLCYAQRSPICCALSLPLAGCQSGDGTIGNRKKFNKVPESAFLIPRRTPTLEAFLPAPLYLFIYFSFLEANTNLCLYGKNAQPILSPHDIKAAATWANCRAIVVSFLIQSESLQAPTFHITTAAEIDFEARQCLRANSCHVW